MLASVARRAVPRCTAVASPSRPALRATRWQSQNSACARRNFSKDTNAPATQGTTASAPPTAATEAPKVAAVPKAAKKRTPLLDRMSAFIAGTAIAATAGYWKLHSDVWDSTMQVRRRSGCSGHRRVALCDTYCGRALRASARVCVCMVANDRVVVATLPRVAAQVENSIANMKQDVVASNADFRRRLARLEHDVAAVRDQQAARS